ncbi:PIN domain-containing protein [Microbacterium protaetiae]|uniref:PIN domain-containing protein n=1 Tax=Microbacterium protaetiae TaxID=2509458 RepID=UPI001F5E17EC|nr:PIN domain-containing protein [Microbacterium protaetiae]
MTDHFYLDSSVAIRILYGQSALASAWFEKATADAVVFSSRLLRTELTRVLRRDNKPLRRRDEILDYISTVSIDDTILAEAEAIIPHVKTLDAIHLASVIRSGLDATIVTHDATMRAVASQIGYATLDPVDPM